MALGLLIAGCGQTGPLYLVMQPTQLPPITHRPAPVPSRATVVAAPCVMVPTPTSNVTPVAAPFPGTAVEGVPYQPGAQPPLSAPSSLTNILPACVIYPSAHPVRTPAAGTVTAPAAATRSQP